jgi:hypothetical protein
MELRRVVLGFLIVGDGTYKLPVWKSEKVEENKKKKERHDVSKNLTLPLCKWSAFIFKFPKKEIS